MSVADLSQETIKELASYLNKFLPVPKGSYDNDSEQYWYYLAIALRDEQRLGDEFNFDAHVWVSSLAESKWWVLLDTKAFTEPPVLASGIEYYTARH